MAWSWNPADASPECRAVVEIADQLARGADSKKLAKPKRRVALQDALAQWLETTADGEPGVEFAIGCVAVAHLINELGGLLEADQGWELVDYLVATAHDAQAWPVDADAPLDLAPVDQAVVQQLLAGELPLVLAYFFAEMGPAPALARAARDRLSEGLAELVNGKGLVHGTQLAAIRPLAACWTRCRAMGARLKPGAWKAAAQRRFASFVREAVRWSDGAGHPLLSDDASPWAADFLAAMLKHGGAKADAAAARALRDGSRSSNRSLPSASCHSENAGLAVMRAAWSPRAAVVAVNYATPEMQVEIAADGRRLFRGVWAAEPQVDGQPLQPVGRWEQVCWFSDADVDYLEFTRDLADGAKLERQILLARRDNFLLLADHLQHAEPATLELAWQLPLAAGLEWRGEEETRDAVLASGKPVARLLPLALPEWRIDPRIGEFTHAAGAVRLAQRAAARALACPLFIDFDPRRARKQCTWRQLTVAEGLNIQPPDVAVGYRAQCGADQWLFYRSQAKPGNRTLLGQNTSNECVIARFLPKSGEIEELLEIEA